MNLLLDTQALLWFVLDDPRLLGDPFDRLIIAQSLVEMVPVVSSDTMFDSYSGVKQIW